MSYEQEFMKEFEAWVNTQIMINDMAHKESQKVYEEDQDERAKDAMIRYESRLDAYQFLLGKFENFKAKPYRMQCFTYDFNRLYKRREKLPHFQKITD